MTTRFPCTPGLPRRRLACLAAIALVGGGAGLATTGAVFAADVYPSKPITVIVPYPPGGSNDVFARIMAKEMGEVLKQPVIIDNRPGASGTTGTGTASCPLRDDAGSDDGL